MDRNKVKKALKFCREIDDEIKLATDALEKYEDKYYSQISSVTAGTVHGTRLGDPTAMTAASVPGWVSGAMKNLRNGIETMSSLKIAILQEIHSLPYPQKSVVLGFYIDGMSWAGVSARVHYGVTQCKKIRNKGLDTLAIKFSKNETIKEFNYPY